MESNPSATEPRVREFYLPATARLSTTTGRIERLLAGLVPQRADESRRAVDERRVLGFYLPATFQPAGSGRVRRVVAALRRRGAAVRSAVGSKVR